VIAPCATCPSACASRSVAQLREDYHSSRCSLWRRDARYWYAMKFPFTEFVAQAAALNLKAAVRAFAWQARKLVVLDLDGTLWGVVIGETGWQGVRLGVHDAVGEAYVDFQKALKTLSARRIALGVVSKNTARVVRALRGCTARTGAAPVDEARH
jgi:predicted enzyme involved in methoxymalonyl-ACP biosynthesis